MTTTTPTRPTPAYQPVPHPDPNPLDCNGHGSHVAGTAAGSGVLANGTTYTGPYNATTISGNSWTIGPGVAPKADLYGLRVFGCEGSTDVVVDAIEWAVDHDMDVINMSLGSPFGTADDPSAVASTNAAKAGVIVVTSAGNSGPNQYIIGLAGHRRRRALGGRERLVTELPGASSRAVRRATITAMNANELRRTRPDHASTVKVITRQSGHDGSRRVARLPPSPTYGASRRARIAVVNRGVCARVAKADLRPAGRCRRCGDDQQRRRPAAVRGPDHANPDTARPYDVTIPFLGESPAHDRSGSPRGNGQTGDARRRRRSRTRTSRASRTSRPAARAVVTAA